MLSIIKIIHIFNNRFGCMIKINYLCMYKTITTMRKNVLRPLTPKELELEKEQKQTRTDYEKRAYRLLPNSMKRCVQRNPAVGFWRHFAYYPDLFFPKERLCIEIDGGIHQIHKYEDEKKDYIFRNRGYTVIRITNADTIVDVAFWECLLYGLQKIQDAEIRGMVKPFIEELRRLIDEKWKMCLNIDDIEDNYVIDGNTLPFINHELMRMRLYNGNSICV